MMVRSLTRWLPLLLALPALTLAGQEPVRGRQPIPEERVMSGRVDVINLRRGRLGIVVQAISDSTDTLGALVASVTPNGPADKAGIRSGDIIVRVNGRALAEKDPRLARGRPTPGLALSLIGSRIRPGDTVVVQYQRGTERKNTQVVAGDEPVWTFTQRVPDLFEIPVPGHPEGEREYRLQVDPGPGPSRDLPRKMTSRMLLLSRPLADLEVVPLNPELGRYFGTDEGVLVINLPSDSKLGLKPGDVVFSVDGRKVQAPAQLLRTLQSYDPGESFTLEIMRLKKRETVTGTTAVR